MRFSERVKLAKPELVVTPRHEAWMAQNANPIYSEAATKFVAEQLMTPTRDRRGTFSASSLDSCRRRQQFTFLGMPELTPATRTAAIFHTGTYMHLRWQAEGLTEGWITEAEVPVGKNDMGLSGTLDGVLYDDSVCELKSINSRGYSQVTSFGPKEAHIMQVATYMHLTGRDKASIIYENKDNSEYTEYRVPLTSELKDAVERTADMVWRPTELRTLVEPLDECIERRGKFNVCPYRDRCLQITEWSEVEERIA